MRVKNYTDETLQPTEDFTIMDTEENEFRPIPLDDPTCSPTRPIPLGADQVYPLPDTAAVQRPDPGLADPVQAHERLAAEPAAEARDRAGAASRAAEIDLDL